ncbi:MAG: ketoacyl-ACP synthase III [Bacteroidota bacterium]|nr:ketoacyl-ACP synthase III [Bacteroidota bacterium]
MKVYIKALAYALPEKILTNAQLVELFPEWSVDKIASKVGVNQRHVAADNETAADLAVRAAENLFKENQIDRSTIDFVLFCTETPDYMLPCSACLIQHELRLPTTCGALDFSLGCSGFIYGLALSKGLIFSGMATNVLLLTGETMTKCLHPKDKGNRTIFGDGASASLISKNGLAEIGEFSFGSDGKNKEDLIIKTGAMRHREPLNDLTFDASNNPVSSDFLYMNGSAVFSFSNLVVPDLVDHVLARNHLLQPDINLFVFHQANKYMINYLRKLLSIEEEKFYIFLENVGNTVSSSIPIALYEAKKEDRLHGQVLLAGFGAGYSWGGVTLNFN